MNFYIVLAISVFAGGSKASGCPIEVTAKEPNYGSEGKFGEVHILSFSRTSGSTSCLWRFSSAKKNLLNLLFINITAQTKSSGSGCNGNYALIKTHDAERLSSTTFDPYCGERSLPGIRINGTIEIELHDRGSRSVDRGISLAVFVESSSKHCGGIYNDSSYGVPVSYDSSLVPRNEITHCVWFFEFLQARSLSVIASYFGLEQDLVTGVPNCSRNKQYLSMRSWNRTNWDSYQEIRECKAQSKQTPIFNLPKTDRFAVTVHSEHWFSSKKLYAVCFPSTEGFSDSKLVINGKGNKTYHDVLLDDPNVVEGLLVLKPKEDNDQLFFAMNHGRQFCNGGTLEIWSEHGNTFHRNSSLCSSPNSDLYSVFNFQDTALLYFKSTVSRLKELKIWFYSSNKGCGGLFPFLPGHSIVVKSPNYGNGKYPANSECRWVFLADSSTIIGIAIKTMQLETCCDYVNIYQGFRKQDAKPYRIQGQGKKYVVTGDMEIYFKSDQSQQRTGFMINITEAFDHCRSSPCSHGNCVVSASSFKCNCHSGYTGKQCETDINECDNNPCQNGGSCRNTAGYYHCTCKADYSGTNCQTCGGTHLLLNGNSTMIASPNFGVGKYPAHSDCQWNFIVSNSTILVIAINEIKLEVSDTTCPFDYIGIYKGVYSAKVRQHKICSKPKMYLQNGNATIKFQSDGSGQGTGFRMDVFAVEDHKYRSCTEALIANGNIGGHYLLLIDSETVFVLCELQGNSIKTMIMHGDGDKRFHVSGYGSFKKTFAYMQNITGITKIIDRSDKCMQAVNVTCHYSQITSFSWLTNRNNQRMSYWAGGPSNGTGCACGRTGSCAMKSKKCNCDTNDQVLRYDMGLVTKKGDLPLTSIRTGDTSQYNAYKDITVGNVVCFNAIPQTTAAAITTSKRTTVTTQSTTTSKTGTKTDPKITPKDSTSNAITTSKRTTVTTQSTTTSKTGTKTDPKITPKDSTSKKYPASITTPTDKATKSGDSKYATATTKITIIGKKGQSSSGNITVYAVSAVSGIIAVIFIVAVIIIIRRRQARSTLKDSNETSSRKERPRQNSAMPLVEMTERPKPFVPDASVTYSVPDNCHQETEVTEWNNPYYESNDTAPPTMEAENLYYGSNVGMTMENPYYESSDQVHTEAEYETTCPDEHLYAAPDANPSKPVYSYATTEELKSGVTGNCEENIYEYADAEQVL